MENKFMKYTLQMLLTLIASITFANSNGTSDMAPGQDGNGAAGVVNKDGVYMTFYSAGLFVLPKKLAANEISGLQDLN